MGNLVRGGDCGEFGEGRGLWGIWYGEEGRGMWGKG